VGIVKHDPAGAVARISTAEYRRLDSSRFKRDRYFRSEHFTVFSGIERNIYGAVPSAKGLDCVELFFRELTRLLVRLKFRQFALCLGRALLLFGEFSLRSCQILIELPQPRLLSRVYLSTGKKSAEAGEE
jgi:hypothetical protein